MAIIRMNFESQYLKSNHEIAVIMPDRPPMTDAKEFYANGRKYKVLWLLHGTFGDYSDWIRRTNIELYACEKDLVVVLPSALNSNYSNWDNAMIGFSMYDYFTEELMPLIYNWLPVSDRREDNFIAGLSMGGRGAIKFAVNYPERFAAAAILSAAVENFHTLDEAYFSSTDGFGKRILGMIENTGGMEAFLNSNENVWDIIDRLSGTGILPRLMFACGTADEVVYRKMQIFKQHAHEIGLDAEFWECDGFRHEWRFWDLAIQHALDFFGLKDTGNSKF